MSKFKSNKLINTILNRLLKEGLNKFFNKKTNKPEKKLQKPISKNPPQAEVLKNHPWRLCPIGQHWVLTHSLKVPASGSGPERKTIRNGHCRINSGKSEVYTAEELGVIADQHFYELLNNKEAMPISDTMGFPNGNKYDLLIAGWTKFWNEVLEPEEVLTPDFVKALIATESSFNLPQDQKSYDGSARGLIQVTENTRKILQDPKGELKNHLIELTSEESREPITNISAGIRWLHHKKKLAEHRLKRKITWEEAGAEYKGILPQLGKHPQADKIMVKLREYHLRLKDQRK